MQSNQFPRALDIARPFRDAGMPVAIGGFHVSGCLAMLDGMRRRARGVPRPGRLAVRGRGRGAASTTVLRDAAAGAAAAALQFHERPARHRGDAGAVPAEALRASTRSGLSTSFDAGRGCPFQCSFCTIINVQGRKSRFRSAGRCRASWCASNWAQGIHKFFITDDNFARNRNWEAIFDRLIELRENATASRSA